MRLVVFWVAFAGTIGLGTRFDVPARDPWNPNGMLTCTRRELRAVDQVVAHPTLPCRALVVVCVPRTGRCALARVGDRGPRRAGLDLSAALSRRLHHNGYELVAWWLVPFGGAR